MDPISTGVLRVSAFDNPQVLSNRVNELKVGGIVSLIKDIAKQTRTVKLPLSSSQR